MVPEFIGCVELITTVDVEEGGWIRAFSNVERLEISCPGMNNTRPNPLLQLSSDSRTCFYRGESLSVPVFLALICSLPILDNLDVGRLLVHYDDIPSRRWLLPPPTGTLDLSLPDGMESVARQLVKLRICERFWRLDFTWWVLEDLGVSRPWRTRVPVPLSTFVLGMQPLLVSHTL